jgi:NADP-dependent 3-hydroxy acid dehydrogenase YdfG
MKFTQQHIQAFCKASHDRNPLHIDAEYARRTQFGKPVVYGMAAVLYGLGQWADGRACSLRTLRAIFRKPLFEGEEYDLVIEATADAVTLRFRKGPVDYAVITFAADFVGTSKSGYENMFHSPFEAWHEAAALPETAAMQCDYLMDGAAWGELEAAYQLHPLSLPPNQIATLLWASYHVGMALPGRQALFSEFQAAFLPITLHRAILHVQLAPAQFDERFNRYTLQGTASGVEQMRIVAFQRPLPVDFPLGAMPQFPDGSQPLAGKVVFISGATRGFGAAMARVCAIAGASLALNYRGDQVAAEALVAELQAHGTVAQAFPADMTDTEAVAEMATAIAARFGQIDLIVNNAAPPIRDLQFAEQSNADWLQFVQQNLAIALETARHLIPLLAPGSQFLHISTKYLVVPVRGFSHYLAAKGAQEAFIQALALEYRDHEFIIARLPRMLTDQTNLPFDFDPPRHPGEVALEAILALADRHPSDNFRVINLFTFED